MTSGRMKQLFSCLIVFLTIPIINLATFAQGSSELGSSRSANNLAGDSPRTSTSAINLDSIDTVKSRISSEGQDRIWQMTGPFGGDVTALATDPRNPDRVLLGTSDGQIFRSIDGGAIWKRIRPGIKAT